MSSFLLTATQVEYSSSQIINYSPALTPNIDITLSSYQVGATGVSYTFKINNTNPLQPNSIVHIYFPATFDIGIPTCTVASLSVNCSPLNSSYLTVNLQNNATTQYGLYSSSIIVNGITNPCSLKPTSTFTIYL
jgi:hypothetical protein